MEARKVFTRDEEEEEKSYTYPWEGGVHTESSVRWDWRSYFDSVKIIAFLTVLTTTLREEGAIACCERTLHNIPLLLCH